ncbi:winged helix-turn-helix transcriptional regulator [Brevibacterium sp. JNUCC-42]|nr:winged helix-turn-helix transcriptional regulator [Brevibacterium sp. JNUCC-42]
MKRAEGRIMQEDYLLSFGTVTVNKRSHSVVVSGEEIDLAPKEYELLLCLLKHYNTVLSREFILNTVWDYDYYGDLRTVDTHIKKLRAKLGDASSYIRTVIRAGYKFEVE